MNDKTDVAQEGNERRNAIGRRKRVYARGTPPTSIDRISFIMSRDAALMLFLLIS